jgi:glutaminase
VPRIDASQSPLQSYLTDLLDGFRGADAGEVASYIPELGRADPDWFAICLCTTDGHVYEVGDSHVAFTIQSISKPFVYGAALEDRGRKEVLTRVGVEPSGNPFNAILVDETNRPFNPMVNAGAIVTTAMIDSEQRIVETLSRYAGRHLTVDQTVYQSESASGDRNRAIAFLMRSFGVIDTDTDAAVDRYFRQCAVSVTCFDLAVMAATLANRGRNPLTGMVALDEQHVESVLSVMSTCGMYDASGDWMFRIGLPAKSGVAGGVLAVLPGQLGVAVFSPRLDSHGNSTRGIKVCERIAADFDLHPMHFQPDVAGVVRRSYSCAEVRSSRLRPSSEVDILVQRGGVARVLELQGELYFGTAERLFREVIAVPDEVDTVVLDCKRVTRIDEAGLRMLDQLRAALDAAGCALLLAGGLDQPDADIAIEWCEDRILDRFSPTATVTATDLAAQELLRGLNPEELAAVTAASRRWQITAGHVLFKQDEPADSVCFILSGALSVLMPLGDAEVVDETTGRLARLGPGVAVGEMALVGDSGRSARVVAVQDTVVAELSTGAIEACAAAHPGLLTHLHVNLARVLADRLRRANDQLRLLAR